MAKTLKKVLNQPAKFVERLTKKKWRDANKDRINQQAKEYHLKNREKRLEYAKKYHKENRKQRLEYARNYHQENKERRLAYFKEWAKNNPEKVKIYSAKWRSKNKEKIRVRDKTKWSDPKFIEWYNSYVNRPDVKERRIKYKREYRLRPDVQSKIKQYKKSEQGRQVNKRSKHKRRSLERDALATLSLRQWKDCLNYFDNKCAYCGENEKDLTQEHFVPVIKGGEYTVKNIIPACGSCNFSKCDKDFFDWYPNQEFYSVSREKKILKYLDIKDNTQQIAMF